MNNPRMTIDDARELMPQFVAGTLAPDQRKEVEALLRSHANLRDDLIFWRNVSQITRQRSHSDLAGHISAEELVQYAETASSLKSGDGQAIADHLRLCPECREDLSVLRSSYSAESSRLTFRFAAAAAIVLVALGSLLVLGPDRSDSPPDVRVVIARLPFVEYYRSAVPDTSSIVKVNIFPQTDSVTLQVEIPLPHQKTTPLRWSMRGPGAGWIEYQGAFQGRATSDGYYVEWQEFGESMFPTSGRYSLKAESPEDGVFYYDIEVVRH